MLGLWVIPWMEERSSCGYDSTTVIWWCFLCISLSSIWNHSLVVSLATLCINTILYLSFRQSSFANTYLYPDHAPALQLLKYLLSFKKKCNLLIIFQQTFLLTGMVTLLLLPPHIFYLHGLDNTRNNHVCPLSYNADISLSELLSSLTIR